MTAVKNFDFGARKHAPKATGKKLPDIPFTLETDGPIYHMRGDVDPGQVSVLALLFARATERGDDKAIAEHTGRVLDAMFTPETVDALLLHLADPQHFFNEDMFMELVESFVSEQAARPTTSPRTSSRSRRPSGTKSTASSSSKGRTSGNSRSTAR